MSLSGTPAEGEPTAAELAERIKALRALHTIEVAPARVRQQTRRDRSPKNRSFAAGAGAHHPSPAPEIPTLPIPEDAPADGAEDTTRAGFKAGFGKVCSGRCFDGDKVEGERRADFARNHVGVSDRSR